MRETKDFKLELKAVNDDGTFEGYLSVYEVPDLGNDVVDRGAFTKTIQENKGIVPLLNNHKLDQDMGILHLIDDEHGLKVRGEMFIEQSALARERHAMAKRYHEAGRPMGLSIGYEAIKKVMEKGLRHLKEVRLFEGSMTLWPMLPVALINSIKTGEQKEDFLEYLDMIQTGRMRWMMMDALQFALDDCLYAQDADAASKVTLSGDCIDQFKNSYLDLLPKLLAMWGEKGPSGFDIKAGRRISAASRALVEEAISKLQALLTEGEGTSEEEAAKSEAVAAAKTDEPESDLHSWLPTFLSDWKAQLQ